MVPRKVHIIPQHPKRKNMISKEIIEILVDGPLKQQKTQQETEFTMISLDKLFFFIFLLKKVVWIEQDKPQCSRRVIGSREPLCISGAISMERRKRVFRQCDVCNGDTFPGYLKLIHSKFKILFVYAKTLDHYKLNKVIK
jgi:hypothetical protein